MGGFECMHDTKQGLRSMRNVLLLTYGYAERKHSIKFRSCLHTEMPYANQFSSRLLMMSTYAKLDVYFAHAWTYDRRRTVCGVRSF